MIAASGLMARLRLSSLETARSGPIVCSRRLRRKFASLAICQLRRATTHSSRRCAQLRYVYYRVYSRVREGCPTPRGKRIIVGFPARGDAHFENLWNILLCSVNHFPFFRIGAPYTVAADCRTQAHRGQEFRAACACARSAAEEARHSTRVSRQGHRCSQEKSIARAHPAWFTRHIFRSPSSIAPSPPIENQCI